MLNSHNDLNRSQSLKSVLETKPGGEQLLQDLERIRKQATPILSQIVATFPEFTIHDIRHSDKVLSILDWLLVDKLKEALNQYEIYFLIASTILHDIGMANLPFLLENNSSFDRFQAQKKALGIREAQIFRSYIRSTHHLRSEKLIIEKYSDLSIENKGQAQIIGRICRGHRDKLRERKMYDHRTMYRSDAVNVPLLAAFLQLADDLDLDFERAPLILFNAMEISNPLSKTEWEKNLSVTGTGPDADDPLSIFVNATSKSDRVHRALKRMEARIQRKLLVLPEHLHQHEAFRQVIPQRITYQIKQSGYTAYDLKFTLQEREIFDLLMGEKLYKKKTACLRELLQNAVDTCRRRASKQDNYSPKIKFHVDQTSRKIVVSDNGIGMNINIVKDYFAKIGQCFYRSPEFLGEECDFTPLSEFGIGILSCFMLADHVMIDTKMEGYDPLRVEITSDFDYISVKKGNKQIPGTAVILYVKREMNLGSLDLEKEIRHYARHLEIPIEVQTQSKRSRLIRGKPFKCNLRDFANRSSLRRAGLTVREWVKAIRQHCDVVNIPITEENMEGNIGILVPRKTKIPPSARWDFFKGRKTRHLADHINELQGVISNEGIYVCDVEGDLGRFLNFFGIVFEVDLKGAPTRLNVSRTDFVRDDEFDNMLYVLLSTFLTYFDKTLEAFTNSEANRNAKAATTFRFFEGIALEHIWDWQRRKLTEQSLLARVCSRLKPLFEKAFYFTAIVNGRYRLLRYRKIRNSKSLVIFNTHVPIKITEYSYTSMPMDFRYMLSHASYFQEKETSAGVTYLVSPDVYMNTNYCRVISVLDKSLHNSIIQLTIDQAIKWTVMTGFEEIIPEGSQIVSFSNFDTDRFIEIIPRETLDSGLKSAHYRSAPHTLINANHPFTELLIGLISTKSGKRFKPSLKTFFKLILNPDTSHEALQLQAMILEDLKKSRLVRDHNRFVLNQRDLSFRYTSTQNQTNRM